MAVNHSQTAKETKLTLVKASRGQDTRHGVVLSHLLQNLDEESDLDLRGLLQQRIEGSSPLSFAQDTEPLFNSAEFILEVLIEGGCSHLLQSGLVLVNIGKPLLSKLLLGVGFYVGLTLTELDTTVEVGRGSGAVCRNVGSG